jgi:mannose-6-phosphate isomerase-like protein (cupin superfamily)
MSPATPAPGAKVEVLDADRGPELAIIASRGRAHAVVWPGMGAELRSLHHITLEPQGETVDLAHPSEAVYCVLEGSGEIADAAAGTSQPLVAGSMTHIDAGTRYVVRADDAGMVLFGGPSPADHALYASIEGSR